MALSGPAFAEDNAARRAEIREQLTHLTAAKQLSRSFNLIHELVAPSVASIHINQALLQLNRNSGNIEKREIEVGEGSGFVVSSDQEYSYLLTNAHVVLQSNRNKEFIRDDSGSPVWHGTIRVSLSDNRVVDAEGVGADTQTDLAVLRIPVAQLPAVTWGDSDATGVGDWVLALGYPLGVGYSASAGIISAKARSTGIYRNESGYESFLQTDAAINPGNSGGPMLNLNGEVVGVNANIISRSGASVGLGFAIPANLAKRVAEDLVNDGKVSRPMIGIQMAPVDPAIAEEQQLRNRFAVTIRRVMPGSPAAEAGLKPGDIILAIEGQSVAGIEQFRTRIASARINEPLAMAIWRNNAEENITVIPGLGRLHRIGHQFSEPAGYHDLTRYGLTLAPIIYAAS